MIDWQKTQEVYGYSRPGYRKNVCAVCDKCGREGVQQITCVKAVKDGQLPWLCKSCHALARDAKPKNRSRFESDAFKAHMSKLSRASWADRELASKMSAPGRVATALLSNAMTECWKDPTKKARHQAAMDRTDTRTKLAVQSRRLWLKPGHREHMVAVFQERAAKLWADPAYRKKTLLAHKEAMARPEVRAKIAATRATMPTVTKIQEALYSILTDLGVSFYRERSDAPSDGQCRVGPYWFDCAVPRINNTTLLIECHGDYWHNLPKHQTNDLRKASYISNNLRHLYDLRCLWEHQFSQPGRVLASVREWLGLDEFVSTTPQLSDIAVRHTKKCEYVVLFSKYHHMAQARNGSAAIGAYNNKQLIAAALFSAPTKRQHGVRELSRYCCDPRFRTDDFQQWFLQRVLTYVPNSYHRIVAHADLKYDTIGQLLLTAGFSIAGVAEPTYWYVAADGWAMHPKSVREHAHARGMNEQDFVAEHHYSKAWSGERITYVLDR